MWQLAPLCSVAKYVKNRHYILARSWPQLVGQPQKRCIPPFSTWSSDYLWVLPCQRRCHFPQAQKNPLGCCHSKAAYSVSQICSSARCILDAAKASWMEMRGSPTPIFFLNLWPTNCYLFRPLNLFLLKKQNKNQEAVENAFEQLIMSMGDLFFNKGIYNPVPHWRKCVNADRAYFDLFWLDLNKFKVL